MDEDRLWHLSDEPWAQVEGAFPQRRGQSGFERKISNPLAFEAVLFRARTGCPWRDLPGEYGEYGDHHTIYTRWSRWVKSGGPQRAMVAWYLEAARQGRLDLSLALIDSTVVRAHQHAAGAHKKRRPGPWAQPRWLEHEDPLRGRERKPGARTHPHGRTGGRRAGRRKNACRGAGPRGGQGCGWRPRL